MSDLSKALKHVADYVTPNEEDDAPLRLRWGQIVSKQVGSVTITIGGGATTIAGVASLDTGEVLAASDVVAILQVGPDLLVLGRKETA